ncbi:hypothetical protein E5339_08300 [Phocaeicola sartorii]|uniref:Uncharacterized protein n=1 Tax=Phocaeicola sartorii TaxID=671267 RepID=A0A4S2FPA9_9BACT|nr:hypothetical protein [Phocaeicola sartorii]TGY70923.1 hypothetical protein E5339_08300 [Phocaeicola sartorii]
MRQRIYIWIAVGIALLLLFGSCRSIRYVPVETIRTDSLYLSVHEHDSIHIKDSVYVKEKGDSVIVDRWHTVYRDRIIHDTIYVEKEKEVMVPYPVEKELTWWQKTKLELGEFSIGVILVLLIVVIWLVKKKGGAR